MGSTVGWLTFVTSLTHCRTGNISQLPSASSHFPLVWILGAEPLSLLPSALLPLRPHTGAHHFLHRQDVVVID